MDSQQERKEQLSKNFSIKKGSSLFLKTFSLISSLCIYYFPLFDKIFLLVYVPYNRTVPSAADTFKGRIQKHAQTSGVNTSQNFGSFYGSIKVKKKKNRKKQDKGLKLLFF